MPQNKAAAQPSLFDEASSVDAAAPSRSQATARKPLADSAQEATRALWSAIEADTPAAQTLTLARALRSAGLLDPSALVGDYTRRPFVEAWIQSAKGYYSRLPVEGLDQLAGWLEEDGADLWSGSPRTDRHGHGEERLGLFRAAMACVDGARSEVAENRDVAAAMEWAIARAPMEQLQKWRSYSHSEPLLSWMIASSLPEKTILAALDRGFSLKDARDDNGELLARRLKTVGLWERFLQDGGDAKEIVATRDEEKAPLWKHLRDRSGVSDELRQAVEAWANAHAGDDLADAKEAEYWSRLGKSWNSAAAEMKKDPNWPNKRDPEGRTPMMVVVSQRPNDYKQFSEIKKAREGILAKDREGRSLWAYMMGKGKDLDAAGLSWLMKTVPLELDAKGRGLFAQALSAGKSEHEAMCLKKPIWQTHSDPKLWWGAGASQQDEFAKMLIEQSWWGSKKDHSPSRFIQQVWAVSRALDVSELSPSLQGALAWVQLLSPKMSAEAHGHGDRPAWQEESGADAAMKMLSNGATLPSLGHASESLRDRFANTDPATLEEAMARSEANELRRSIQPQKSSQQLASAPNAPARRL